jgi:hypothetical protein
VLLAALAIGLLCCGTIATRARIGRTTLANDSDIRLIATGGQFRAGARDPIDLLNLGAAEDLCDDTP